MTVVAVAPAGLPAVPEGRYRATDVARSEWTKLTTVRSTTWSLVATIVLTIGVGVLTTAVVAFGWHHLNRGFKHQFDPVRWSLTGLFFGQLTLGVLGVLVVTGEYGTGTIRSTLTAAPNRLLVLAAKIAVLAAVVLTVSEALMFFTFFIGQAILAGHAPHASIGQPGVARAVVSGGLYITLLALLAMGLASIIRHTAGALSVFAGIVYILPVLLQFFPSSVANTVGRFVPAQIGAIATSVNAKGFVGDHTFAPWAGLLVLAGYAAATLLVGGWLMYRRDA